LPKAAPQAVLMVDEAYFHFHGETTLGDVGSVPNLIVARTFSKAYGLASLRIGMLAGDARLIGYVRKVSSPYNVNGVALAVLPEALADDEYLNWYVAQVAAGRERMFAALKELERADVAERGELRADGHWPAAQGAGRGDARARRAAARPVERSGVRGLCAHHPRRGGARDARDCGAAGVARRDAVDAE
jgi:7-keto-8-aminopelargonate synthetase-like enzyme